MSAVTNPQDLIKFLPTIPLFGGLEEPTLNRVISMLHEHRLERGAVVCKQGDSGRDLFLVRMGEGEFFGEMTLIDIQKRSATVRVDKPAVVYSLGNKDLYRLYQEDVPGYVMILQNICRELSRRLRTTNRR